MGLGLIDSAFTAQTRRDDVTPVPRTIRVVLPIRRPPEIPDDDTVSTDPTEDRDRRAILSIAAIAAMFVAYLPAFTVLTDTDMASRFENGVPPPGSDLAGIRAAAVASVAAALGSWTAAVASRATGVSVAVLVATAPFALLSLVTFGLAF